MRKEIRCEALNLTESIDDLQKLLTLKQAANLVLAVDQVDNSIIKVICNEQFFS